jgi:hypothetical protein
VISTVTTRIAVAAAGLVLAGAAAAAAVGSPPSASDEGRATAEEHTGFPVPVAAGRADEVVADDDADDDEEVEAPEVEAPEDEENGGGPVDNHGAAVSAVATDHTVTGSEHGQAVSEVARSDAGKPSHGDGEADEGDDGGEIDEGAPQGAEQGQGHGKP